MNRYDVSRLNEAQFEPGSRGRVLKNLLGVCHVREMNMIEAERLAEATDWAIRHYSVEQQFTAADIRLLHRQWLGQVYPWAGEYRQVNIGNGRLARLLSSLMALQAGLPLLDFSGVTGRVRREYFSAVQASMGRDYEPMREVFRLVVRRSERG